VGSCGISAGPRCEAFSFVPWRMCVKGRGGASPSYAAGAPTPEPSPSPIASPSVSEGWRWVSTNVGAQVMGAPHRPVTQDEISGTTIWRVVFRSFGRSFLNNAILNVFEKCIGSIIGNEFQIESLLVVFVEIQAVQEEGTGTKAMGHRTRGKG